MATQVMTPINSGNKSLLFTISPTPATTCPPSPLIILLALFYSLFYPVEREYPTIFSQHLLTNDEQFRSKKSTERKSLAR